MVKHAYFREDRTDNPPIGRHDRTMDKRLDLEHLRSPERIVTNMERVVFRSADDTAIDAVDPDDTRGLPNRRSHGQAYSPSKKLSILPSSLSLKSIQPCGVHLPSFHDSEGLPRLSAAAIARANAAVSWFAPKCSRRSNPG